MASTLIFERAFELDEDQQLQSYWEARWPTWKLLEMYLKNPVFFSVSYLNDPHGLQGNALSADWVHFYLPETLEAARRDGHSSVSHIAIDTGAGGTGKDPDYSAGMKLERIGNRGFFTEKFNKRLPLELQAQYIEDWVSRVRSDYLWVEDITTRGYVWKDLSKSVNNNQGSRHSFSIYVPDKKMDKMTRYLSVAPRLEAGQIMVPGVVRGNKLTVHPDWEDFMGEWNTVPAGHDDLLDCMYLTIHKAFADEEVVGFIVDAVDDRVEANLALRGICIRPAHLAYGKPMRQCGRCTLEAISQIEREDEEDVQAIGTSLHGLFH